MVTCALCGNQLKETFLNKVLGTCVKDAKGKKHWACSACHRSKAKGEILAALR